MLSWSVPRGWRPDNPVREVKPLKGGEGYEAWPWEVIEAAKVALAPYLWWAVALALYTGQRLGDVLAMKWSDIESGGIWVVQEKTGKRLLIPLHRDLQAVLETIPKTAVTILTNSDGIPWQGGFQATWRKRKPAATKGLVFHGLRKSAVVTLLEVGCSTAEVSAITGQTMQMVEHYAKQVNQKKLAAAAILRWENASATENANTIANTVPSIQQKPL
jgi:integrase